MSYDDEETSNLAATLANILPKVEELGKIEAPDNIEGLFLFHYAVPKGADVKELKLDLEQYLPAPRRTKAVATFDDPASFLAYVARHAAENTVVWCAFNPQTFALRFDAVIDEHAKGVAGWRAHRASFVPEMSAEWKVWKGGDRKSMPQVTFAEWIQEHEDDINSAKADQGLPTSLQMLKMATEFVAQEERVLKSAVRLESGGVRLTYIADPDAGTTAEMRMFEKFALGFPVFHGGAAWGMEARLKYRLNSGKVNFHYELVRPDRVHEHAAKDLIAAVRDGLAAVPLLMGSCS